MKVFQPNEDGILKQAFLLKNLNTQSCTLPVPVRKLKHKLYNTAFLYDHHLGGLSLENLTDSCVDGALRSRLHWVQSVTAARRALPL